MNKKIYKKLAEGVKEQSEEALENFDKKQSKFWVVHKHIEYKRKM